MKNKSFKSALSPIEIGKLNGQLSNIKAQLSSERERLTSQWHISSEDLGGFSVDVEAAKLEMQNSLQNLSRIGDIKSEDPSVAIDQLVNAQDKYLQALKYNSLKAIDDTLKGCELTEANIHNMDAGELGGAILSIKANLKSLENLNAISRYESEQDNVSRLVASYKLLDHEAPDIDMVAKKTFAIELVECATKATEFFNSNDHGEASIKEHSTNIVLEQKTLAKSLASISAKTIKSLETKLEAAQNKEKLAKIEYENIKPKKSILRLPLLANKKQAIEKARQTYEGANKQASEINAQYEKQKDFVTNYIKNQAVIITAAESGKSNLNTLVTDEMTKVVESSRVNESIQKHQVAEVGRTNQKEKFISHLREDLRDQLDIARLVAKGAVTQASTSVKDQAVDMVQIAAGEISIPIVQQIAEGIMAAYKHYDETVKASICAKITATMESITPEIILETANSLAESYGYSKAGSASPLDALTDEGIKTLSNVAVLRIITQISKGEISKELLANKPEQTLVSAAQKNIGSSSMKNHALKVKDVSQHSNWTAEGLLSRTAIITQDGQKFVPENKRQDMKYGFRLGTKEEALSLGLENQVKQQGKSGSNMGEVVSSDNKLVFERKELQQQQNESIITQSEEVIKEIVRQIANNRFPDDEKKSSQEAGILTDGVLTAIEGSISSAQDFRKLIPKIEKIIKGKTGLFGFGAEDKETSKLKKMLLNHAERLYSTKLATNMEQGQQSKTQVKSVDSLADNVLDLRGKILKLVKDQVKDDSGKPLTKDALLKTTDSLMSLAISYSIETESVDKRSNLSEQQKQKLQSKFDHDFESKLNKKLGNNSKKVAGINIGLSGADKKKSEQISHNIKEVANKWQNIKILDNDYAVKFSQKLTTSALHQGEDPEIAKKTGVMGALGAGVAVASEAVVETAALAEATIGAGLGELMSSGVLEALSSVSMESTGAIGLATGAAYCAYKTVKDKATSKADFKDTGDKKIYGKFTAQAVEGASGRQSGGFAR